MEQYFTSWYLLGFSTNSPPFMET